MEPEARSAPLSQFPWRLRGQSHSHRTPPEYDRRKRAAKAAGTLRTRQTAHKRLRRWIADGAWDKILAEVIVRDDAVGLGEALPPRNLLNLPVTAIPTPACIAPFALALRNVGIGVERRLYG
jgi:hypothetical protein